jgi:hypothetical protein
MARSASCSTRCSRATAVHRVRSVAKENRRPDLGGVIELAVGTRRTIKCLWVDTVEQLRSINTDKDYLFTPLHRDLAAGR